MADLKLLGSRASAFSFRVEWALKLKGLDYEYLEEDVSNKSDLLLHHNPVHKKVPVFIHGGKPIAESTVILEYIEDTWPQIPLLPRDPYQKAIHRFWIKFGEDKSPTFYAFFHKVGEEQVNAIKEAKEVLKTIEADALGDKKFFSGDEIGMADLTFGWIAVFLDIFEEAVGVKVIDAEDFPRLYAWMGNFREVPVINDNLPDRDEMIARFKCIREVIIASAKP